MRQKIYLTLCLVAFSFSFSFSQSNFGEIRGKVIDSQTKATLDFLDIIVKRDGINKGGGFTDENGAYMIKALEPGTYTLIASYQGYQKKEISNVTVTANNISYVNFEMKESTGETLGVVVKVAHQTEIIEIDKNQKSIGSKELVKLPTRSVGALAGTTSGATQTAGGGVSFLGQRTDATQVFIDGVPVIGSSSLPQQAQSQVDIIQSGIPAQFGDFTGGAISITTKGPTRRYVKSLEVVSSSPFDKYHYNYAQGFLSGPLIIKNKGGGDNEYVALGFQLSGDFRYAKDASPRYGGEYVITDEALAELEESPLAPNPLGSGFVPRSSFLTKDDLILEKARRNVASISSSVQLKLEYQPNKNTTVTFFGSGNYSKGKAFSRNQYLLNYQLNGLNTDQTYRGYLKFTQRIRNQNKDDKETASKSLITDAFYTVRLDYQTRFIKRESPDHKDDLFKYGYVGKFSKYRTPSYTFNSTETKFIDQKGDTVTRRGFFEFSGYRDTLITFEASDANPSRAKYTSNFFDDAASRGETVFSEGQIFEGLGILNGRNVPSTYSLYFNPGTNNVFLQKFQFERFSAYAMGEATLNLKNKHDIQFGMTYEQNLQSRYGISATNLWQLMPQLANSHLSDLEKITSEGVVIGGIHHYDENGVFLDSVTYKTRIDYNAQTSFDKNLRAKLISEGRKDVNGNLINESSFIDVNSLSPDDLSIDMFSADDLWNNGNSYVVYYGYDHKGKRARQNPSLAEFLHQPDKRSIGSFAPIYSAAWLQDKFAFKDLIFRVGVRVERYDANQFVLKDPYSLFPIKTVSETGELAGKAINHPNSIGDDYAVYVNNTENPSEIIGYRKDNTWYNAEGIEVSTPDILANQTNNGQIQPYLVDAENQDLVRKSFKDYEPQINVLPRVWFSFPINTEAQFFANYDVLAQRPSDGITFTPINQYYFLEASQSRTIANASMKPRIRTNYEVGFKQKIGDNQAISIITSYAETRNDFGLIRLYKAYPVTYNTYANIDFSTTKSFRVEYELRTNKRISLSANYALLFADGTGSNVNSQSALIAANQPNLRSLYPLDVDVRHKIVGILDYSFESKQFYKGPIWFGKKIFANSGVNFIAIAKSGTPYSRDGIATSRAQADLGRLQRAFLDGNPMGSRLPWQFKVDMNAQKTFIIKKKNPKDFRSPSMKITTFLWVQNLFNNRIIRGVYGYTGLPTDDGYLNSPQGQQYISEQINAQSFVDLYNIKINNPSNFALPRLARFGVRLIF